MIFFAHGDEIHDATHTAGTDNLIPIIISIVLVGLVVGIFIARLRNKVPKKPSSDR